MAEMKLDSEVQYLKGVGPRRAAALAGVGIVTIHDLLNYLPRRYLDRTMVTPIGSLKANMDATIIGEVLGKGILKGKRSRLEVMIGDSTGYVALIWFAGYRYLEKAFNKGDILAVTGPVTYFQQLQIVHPEIERIEDETSQLIHTGRIVPVYPSTADLKGAGLTGRIMRQIIVRALAATEGKIVDFLSEKYQKEENLFSLSGAFNNIHYPENIESAKKARKRLAFNELLELQYLILGTRKHYTDIAKGHHYNPPGKTVSKFARELPFKMTPDQQEASRCIFNDMAGERPMHRLLQGDVGCGKTVVAIMASVYAAENKLQVVFMAPTEILADQHYRNWQETLLKYGLESGLLIGSMKKAEHKKIIDKIAAAQIDIVFGTHAVLSESVQFKNLGLVIIDEQHRFGVLQRGQLIGKGARPDTLVMTATPIPRTLALTLYGDLDITSIRSMPPGRQPIKTVWRTANSRPDIYKFLRTRLEEKEQIFIIYPLVEKSDKLDLQAAEEEYQRLKKEIFSDYNVGLVHGRIKKESKDKTVSDFRAGKLDILVATTVIEVGIDIPSASIMVIEHAERFGLSQLHQLRGRVGRGDKKGMAIAIATPPISDIARQRLEMFQSSNNGFEISEADLKLRGPGEFFGTRQHGLPELRVADLSIDTELLPVTRKIAAHLIASGEKLDSEDRDLLKYLSKKSDYRGLLARFG
jgi:ATP-dependent DNA helicase RecG